MAKRREIVAFNIMCPTTKEIYINKKPIASAESFTNDQIYKLNAGESVIEFDVEIIDLNVPTRNLMKYDDFQQAINSERWVTMMKTGSAYGEIDHPLNPQDLTRWANIDMTKASHVWRKTWITDDNKLWGKVQTFTGNGNLMWHAIKCGELPSFSIRVMGECMEENGQRVLKNTILVSIDWVRFPGSRNSFVPDTSVFRSVQLPLLTDYSVHNRVSLKAENANFLGIDINNTDLISIGEGTYVTVDKIKKDDKKKYWENRLSSF